MKLSKRLVRFPSLLRAGLPAGCFAKEFNLISWNDRDAKYDIREWSPDGEKMGKGVTLSREEMLALKELLNKIEL